MSVSNVYPHIGNNFRDQICIMQHPNHSAFSEFGAKTIKDFSLDPEYFNYLAYHTGWSVDELIGRIAYGFTPVNDGSDFYLIGEKAYHVLSAIKGFRPYTANTPCVLSLWDFGGQRRYDVAKAKLPADSNYSSIFMDIKRDNNKSALMDFSLLNTALVDSKFKYVHSIMANFTFLDKLAVDGVFNEKTLGKAYKDINDEYEVAGELVNKLKSFVSPDGINFSFLGAKVSSARPCTGFLNANIDFVTVKYLYDINLNADSNSNSIGNFAKLSYMGDGAQGKSQNLFINEFLQKSTCTNWLGDRMTVGVRNLASKIYRESFFENWTGEQSVNFFASGEFPVSLESVLNTAVSMNPASFGLVLKGDYKDPDKCFYPSADMLNSLMKSWNAYAVSKISHCDSYPVFQEYFGIDNQNYFRNHQFHMRDRSGNDLGPYNIKVSVCDALTLDESLVAPVLRRIGVKEEFIK